MKIGASSFFLYEVIEVILKIKVKRVCSVHINDRNVWMQAL